MPAIIEINSQRRTPKYQQIVNSVTKAIREGRFKMGDRIFSINELSSECSLSRDTVQKAYDLLEKEKVIEAVKGKGFYINRTDVLARYRVLLIFNKLSNYKTVIYDSFVRAIGSNGSVELRIHHSNARVLEEILKNNRCEYDHYVVMPHFYEQTAAAREILNKLPREKLLFLDKDMCFSHWQCRGVFQDFENDIRNALISGLDALRKYNKLVYVHPTMTPHPTEIKKGFKRFCSEFGFREEIIKEVSPVHDVRRGEVYVVIEESDLANVIKNCRRKNLRVGHDIGIISYNETPIKSMLLDGITVISTDHARMGDVAARMIMDRKNERIKIPFRLILRNSL
ncbi:MAG: GntR family transcriptional regulator [Chitinophagaceae bacterium]|nr:GntR family transcriptional regulator [Chitinophagaceae bacterium]